MIALPSSGPAWFKMWIRLTFLLLFVVQSGWAAVQCDSDDDTGHTECVPLPVYNNQYQWATCLTNDYIQQKSKNRHVCQHDSTYCWYQCMIEIYGKGSGAVSYDCSCDPNKVNPTQKPLPQECYSPSGDSCDWYRNCLEKNYPCVASSNAYSIRYAERFCRSFDNRSRAEFSADAQKWTDGVRKCLQVALVPLLRPWVNPSCRALRVKAFASHTPCYLNPDKDVPSICDLSYLQYTKIFWTIKGSFVLLDTAWESSKECGT